MRRIVRALLCCKSCSKTAPLIRDDYDDLSEGYEFLSDLDHNLRLTVGRSTRVPASKRNVLEIISARMGLASAAELLEKLTLHRLNIRAAFDKVFHSIRIERSSFSSVGFSHGGGSSGFSPILIRLAEVFLALTSAS